MADIDPTNTGAVTTTTVEAQDNEYPLFCVARATFRKYIKFTNNDIVTSPLIFNGSFEVKTHKEAAEPLFVGTVQNGYVLFTSTTTATFLIPDNITKTFAFSKAYYHFFVINKSINFTRRLLHGPFYCEQT